MIEIKRVIKAAHARSEALHALAPLATTTSLCIATAVLYLNPAERFEESIYTESGLVVWMLVVFAVLMSFSTALLGYLDHRASDGHLAWNGVLSLGASYLLVLVSPYLRGYAAYGRSDIMVHVGLVKDMLTGQTWTSNPYPVVHLVMSFACSVTGAEPEFLARYVPVIVYLVYWSGLYLLSGEAFATERRRILVMLIGMPLMFSEFSIEVLPLTCAVALVPFLVYLWIKAFLIPPSPTWGSLWTLVCLGLPLVHPFFAFHVAVALAFGAFAQRASPISRIIHKAPRSTSELGKQRKPFRGTSAMVVVIALLLWLWNVERVWELAVRQGYAAMESPLALSSLALDYQQVENAMMTPGELLATAAKMYGHMLVYVVLAGGVALATVAGRRRVPISPHIDGIAAWYLGLCLAGAASLLAGLGSWRSLLAPASLSPILLAGIVETPGRSGPRRGSMRTPLVVAVVIVGHVTSVLAYFPDPYTHRVSSHVTAAEIAGMRWFIDSEGDHPTRTLTWRMRQFGAYLFGAHIETAKSGLFPGPRSGERPVPEHFDLASEENPSLTPILHVAISQYDRAYYLSVFRDSGRFNEDDFERFLEGPGISRIYSNGDVDIFRVDLARLRH